MTSKNTLPITEARRRIFDIAEEVQRPDTYFTFTEKGRPKVVMMSADEFDSWTETLEVMSMFPDLDKDIAEAKKDLRTGKYRNYASLNELLKKEGYVVADKSKRTYAVFSKVKTKSGKRARKTGR